VNIRIVRKKPVDPIESGSLSDMAFLLIIYFIVIAGFNVNAGFLLNLPVKGSQRIVNTQELVKLRLDAAGSFLMDGRTVTVAGAESELRAAITIRPNLTVVLSIDPDCPWQNVVDVISMAQRNKVENFSFKSESSGARATGGKTEAGS
jgi:biopolymer transport protein ExbD